MNLHGIKEKMGKTTVTGGRFVFVQYERKKCKNPARAPSLHEISEFCFLAEFAII